MNRTLRLAAIGLILTLGVLAHPVAATSFVMVSDGDLVDQALLVVEATVAGIDHPLGPSLVTDYHLRVERTLKGLAEDEVVLRVPGGRGPDGEELLIVGAPHLVAGERGLFFLRPGAGGVWRSLHLMLGTFREVRVGDRRLAARNLAGTVEVGPGGLREGAEEHGRDFQAFARWIQRRAAGWPAPEDYFVPLAESDQERLEAKFTHIVSRGFPTRWFDFDEGRPVTWHAESTGQPGMDGGGFAQVEQALAAWTHEAATSIHLVYGGTVAPGQDPSTFTGLNIVYWADPHELIESPFECGSGGVLAVGGPSFIRTTPRSFQGREYTPIAQGFVNTNRGIECFLLGDGPRLAEILSHEAGHALGLRHSCGDDASPPCIRGSIKDRASMRAQIHNDRRGASLEIDDAAAVRFLYAVGDDCRGGSARGGEVLCLHGDRFRLEVAWENQFDDSSGIGFTIPSSDLSGFFYFTDPRNLELVVKLLDFGDRILFFSGQLTNLHFAITVTDTLTGDVKVYTNGPGNCGEIDQNAFSSLRGGSSSAGATGGLFGIGEARPGPGIPHHLRLQPPADGPGLQGALLLDDRRGALPKAGQCHPGPGRLCLLGGRVAAELTWRNQFNESSGAGRAESLSDLTGSFSFDNPANLEVLLKALDFGDRILILWGSLSNLEYALQVTDTVTGAVRRYENPAGTYCGGLDEAAF